MTIHPERYVGFVLTLLIAAVAIPAVLEWTGVIQPPAAAHAATPPVASEAPIDAAD